MKFFTVESVLVRQCAETDAFRKIFVNYAVKERITNIRTLKKNLSFSFPIFFVNAWFCFLPLLLRWRNNWTRFYVKDITPYKRINISQFSDESF